MFSILDNYKTAVNVLFIHTNKLKKKGYTVYLQNHKLDSQYTIDKIIIKSKKKTTNRLVISSGLHGVEGYVGHAAIHAFFDNILDTLNSHTEVVIYPALNPYGMSNHLRTNRNNVDLNRNFSKTDFSLVNEGYEAVKEFVEPKPFKNSISMNSSFYFNLTKLIKNHGVEYLNRAFLLGQNTHPKGIYYTGTTYEPETQYIMKEFVAYMRTKTPLTWIDIHSGYGPKNQMSIINSRYEVDVTKEMIENIDYPLILGINDDDIYDTDGDIIEKFYEIKSDKFNKTDFYGTSFEFGTNGEGTFKSIESLKAVLTMNHIRYVRDNKKMKKYAIKLMKKQFAPKNEKWRAKAHQDFIQATTEILKYRKLV